MPNPLPLVALAGDDAVTTATISMSNEDAEFPAENAQSYNPAKLAKSTTNTTTFTITTSSITPVAIALIQTNAETATLNGLPITIPVLDSDGQRIHPWLDMRGSPEAAGTSWTLVLSKASGVVFIGRICLVVALHALNVRYGWEVGRNRPGEVTIETRMGVVLKHTSELRSRYAQGVVNLLEDEALLASLDSSAKGSNLPYLLIPDEDTNDAWYVRQSSPYRKGYPDIDVRETPLRFDELVNGPVNG
jgi:hypothetical protein